MLHNRKFSVSGRVLPSCNITLYAAQDVVLDSSVDMRQACPGETVTYTCTVNQGFQLDWIVEPFLPAERIQFTTTDTIGRRLNCTGVVCEDFDFVATLTNTTNPTVVSGTNLADMTSTLTITTKVRLNGTVVQCRGSIERGVPITNNTLSVAGASIYLIASRNRH